MVAALTRRRKLGMPLMQLTVIWMAMTACIYLMVLENGWPIIVYYMPKELVNRPYGINASPT